MVTFEKIHDAARVLDGIVRHTELIPSTMIDGCRLYLKPENLQYTGSFKLRGAAYKIATLSDEEKARGVVACSAGNHAQGVARSAQRFGIKSVICMPDTAPLMKIDATKSYGAEVCLVPGVYDDAHDKAVELQHEQGYTFVHPFDDDNIIAGQGTIGIEIMSQLHDADAIVCAIGGGGLISGVAIAAKYINPKVKIYGVQAERAASMFTAVKSGRIVRLPSVNTFADGIAVKEAGENTYRYVSQYVDDVVTVSDDEIACAILAMIEKHKIVAEGAGAAPVAAVMCGRIPCEGKKVVCVVSGGNIDVGILSKVIERGLIGAGRTHTVRIDLPDRPGQLNKVSSIIAECGGNILQVHHDRGTNGHDIAGCGLQIKMETRNFDQIERIDTSLRDAGYLITDTK